MTPDDARDNAVSEDRRGGLRRWIPAALAVPVVVLAALLVARLRSPDEGQPLFCRDQPSEEQMMSRRATFAEMERLVARVESGEDKSGELGSVGAFTTAIYSLEPYWQSCHDDAARARRVERLDMWLRMLAALDARIDRTWSPHDVPMNIPWEDDRDPKQVARRKEMLAFLNDPRTPVQDWVRRSAKAVEKNLTETSIEGEYGPFPADKRQLTERITARIPNPELRDRLLAKIRR